MKPLGGGVGAMNPHVTDNIMHMSGLQSTTKSQKIRTSGVRFPCRLGGSGNPSDQPGTTVTFLARRGGVTADGFTEHQSQHTRNRPGPRMVNPHKRVFYSHRQHRLLCEDEAATQMRYCSDTSIVSDDVHRTIPPAWTGGMCVMMAIPVGQQGLARDKMVRDVASTQEPQDRHA